MADRSPVLISAGSLLVGGALLLWARTPADLAIHHALTLHAAAAWVGPARALTDLGGMPVMAGLALLVVFGLIWRGERHRALWLFATVAIGRLLVEGLKLIVHRPRPPIADHLQHVTSWSFPSSHSAGTMMTCVALALLSGRRLALVPALIVAGAVGWSRVALGVHWPSDVLAGWGLGLLWAGAAWRYGGPMRSG